MSNQIEGFVKGIILGGVIGAAIGILYAPQSGRKTRKDINNKRRIAYGGQKGIRGNAEKGQQGL